MNERANSMPVSELSGDDIITVDADATIADVACVLTDSDVGAVGVGGPGDIAGIVSERDIVRLVAGGGDPTTVRAEEVASTELVTCDETSTVGEVALEMFDKYVRHVLVLSDGVPASIVSARDLLGVYAGEGSVDEFDESDEGSPVAS